MDSVTLESMIQLLKDVATLGQRSEALEREMRSERRTSDAVDEDSHGNTSDGSKIQFTQQIAEGILSKFHAVQSELTKLADQQDALNKRISAVEKRPEEDGVDMDQLKHEEDEQAADAAFFGASRPYVEDRLDKVDNKIDAILKQVEANAAATDAHIIALESEVATLGLLVNEQIDDPNRAAQPSQQYGGHYGDTQRRQERAIDSLMQDWALLDAYRELSDDTLMIPDDKVHSYMSWTGNYVQIDALRQRVCRRLALYESTKEWKEHADKMVAKWQKERSESC